MKNLIFFFAIVIFVGTISCSKSGKREPFVQQIPPQSKTPVSVIVSEMDSLYQATIESVNSFIDYHAKDFSHIAEHHCASTGRVEK